MNDSRSASAPKPLGGLRALPGRLRFAASLGKYAFRKKEYPLFTLRKSRGGLAAARSMLHELKLCKQVSFRGHLYFSPSTPRWPSKAFDRMVGRGGLNITAAGTPWKRQIDMAILGISRKCAYSCSHCYEHFNLSEKETIPVERWAEAIRGLQEEGTAVIVLSGGEPMLRLSDVLALLRRADHDRSEFHLHTSGHGVTAENARELRKAGLAVAAVGLDHVVPERHNALRGYPGAFGEATNAVRVLQRAGLFTYLNTCLTRHLVRSGGLPWLLKLARDLGAGFVRFLEPRPCGGFLGSEDDVLLTDEDRAAVEEFYVKANLDRDYRRYPLISYEAYSEAPERLGCMMGGQSHLSIDSRGNVLPCVFLPVSFGNILDEPLSAILVRMRAAIPHPLHDLCPSLQLAEILKARKDRGAGLPVAIESIGPEWKSMIERSELPRYKETRP